LTTNSDVVEFLSGCHHHQQQHKQHFKI